MTAHPDTTKFVEGWAEDSRMGGFSRGHLKQTNEPLLKLLPAKQELIAQGKLLSGKWMNHPAKALGRLEKALVEGSFREFRHFRQVVPNLHPVISENSITLETQVFAGLFVERQANVKRRST